MFGSSTSAFNFGGPATSTAQTTTQPAFGGFGTTATSNPSSSFGFGSTTNNTTTTSAFNFGQTNTLSGAATGTGTGTGLFGASTGQSAFGQPATASTGFGQTGTGNTSFGGFNTSTNTANKPFGGFGTTATSNPSSSFGFGSTTNNTTTTSAFNFGQTNTLSGTGTGVFGSSTGQSAFGQPAAASTGFGQTATGNTAFGGFNTAANTGNKPFGTTGFGFGASTGGAFGQQQQQQQQQNFAQPQPTLTLTLPSTTSVPTSTEPTKTSTSVGLGGTQLTTATEKAAENVSKISILESPVPQEFMPLVENMKNFIDQQKRIRDENAHEHYYSDAILEIGTAISDVLKVKVNKIEIDLQRSEKLVENLKKDTNRLLNHGELAHRISKTDIVQSSGGNSIPGSNQNNFINLSVHQYFNEIVEGFRTQMKKCEAEIMTLKSYCESSNDKLYSYEEITQIMKKQHDNFVLLAAKVYAIHEYANHLRAEEAKNKDCDSGSSAAASAPTRSSFGLAQRNGTEFEGPSPFLSAKNYVAGLQK